MLVREIIDRVRNDLDDNRTVEYTNVDLLDRIRVELNDRAETETAIDVLAEVRKILGDDATRTGEEVSLDSIRAELNDTADVTAVTAAAILAYLRELLGDDATRTGEEVSLDSIRAELNDTADVTTVTVATILSYLRELLGDDATRTGTAVSLSSIRAELNDTADVSPVTNTNMIMDAVIAKLGIVSDSVIGTTTTANVTADSVIHYAEWGNIGNVSGTNGNINGSVVLNSYNMLSTYAADGIKTIKGMRPDALLSNGELSGGFQAALNLYVLARCLEGEVETNAGNGGYKTFYEQFERAVAAVPKHISDAGVANFISLGSAAIAGRRPDLGLCNATVPLLEEYATLSALQKKNGTPADFSSFYAELDKIPYHYTSAELNQYITDGQNAIKALRTDAASMINCFSDAVKSYAICHAMGRRFGKAAEAMSVWQAHDANFKSVIAAVPYHWTDAELTAFSETGGNVISVKRPDLSGTGAESVGRLHYTVFSALERRIGADNNAAALHKVHYEQFYSDLENMPYHWTDEELTNFQTEAIQTISSLRDDITDGMKIRSDLVPALLFCVSSLANNLRKDAASRNLSDAQWTKLVNLIKSLPYHWTDTELLNQVHDSIRDILAKRSDARMDDFGYELAGIETEPLIGDPYPLRTSFAKASEWFSAAGAISCRIGSDSGADMKYQTWIGRYNEQIMGKAKGANY